MILRLVVVGFGNVGQEFARLLLKKRDWLLKSKGLDIEVLAIATKTKGSLISKSALDLDRVLKHIAGHGTLADFGPEATKLTPLEIIDSTEADLMVELTPLNIETGQPAIDHIKAAFDVSMDVVTANKGPIAHAYKELRSYARSRGVHFRFEGTVMDGTPIFNLVEKTLPGCEVLGLKGILNSTSNFVLSEMSKGRSMDEAVKEAHRLGFAEANPDLDIDGWDAAAKITALANVLMDADTKPSQADRRGIRGITKQQLDEAAGKGERLHLIATAERVDGNVRLSVGPVADGPESPFWSVTGTSSALTIRTDLMGDLTIVEHGPAVSQTAYAILSDLLLVVESIRAGTI